VLGNGRSFQTLAAPSSASRFRSRPPTASGRASRRWPKPWRLNASPHWNSTRSPPAACRAARRVPARPRRAFYRWSCRAGALEKNGDEAVIAELVDVRGIGRWTAEMFSFQPAPPDVWPSTTSAAEAVALHYLAGERPTPKSCASRRAPRALAHGGTWYLWRSLDRQWCSTDHSGHRSVWITADLRGGFCQGGPSGKPFRQSLAAICASA